MRSLCLVSLFAIAVGLAAGAGIKCKKEKAWAVFDAPSAHGVTTADCEPALCISWYGKVGLSATAKYLLDCAPSEDFCTGHTATKVFETGDLLYWCTAGAERNTMSVFSTPVLKCITHGAQPDIEWPDLTSAANHWMQATNCGELTFDQCRLTYDSATHMFTQGCSTTAECSDVGSTTKMCCNTKNCFAGDVSTSSKKNYCVKSSNVDKPLTVADRSMEHCASVTDKCHTTLTLATMKYTQGCTTSSAGSASTSTEVRDVCDSNFCNDGRRPGFCFKKASAQGDLNVQTTEATGTEYKFCFVTDDGNVNVQGKGASTLLEKCHGHVDDISVQDGDKIYRCCNWLGCNAVFSPEQQRDCPAYANHRNILDRETQREDPDKIFCKFTESTTAATVVSSATSCTVADKVGCCNAIHGKSCIPTVPKCIAHDQSASVKTSETSNCHPPSEHWVACHVTRETDGKYSQGCVKASDFEMRCGGKYRVPHYHHGKTTDCHFHFVNKDVTFPTLNLACFHTDGASTIPGTMLQVCTVAQTYCKNTVSGGQYTQGCAASCTAGSGVSCCQYSHCNAVKPTSCITQAAAITIGATASVCAKDYCMLEKILDTPPTYAQSCISKGEFHQVNKCNGHANAKVSFPNSQTPTKEFFCCATNDCNGSLPA